MKKQILLLLLLLISFSFAADGGEVTPTDQSTPYVLTEFPLAILPVDTAVWIKWAGLSELGGDTPDSGATIYYGRNPGGSDVNNYPNQIDPDEVIENNVYFEDKAVKERGIKFVPGDITGMETGIYYLMVAYKTALGTYLYSNEIKFIVRSPDSPVMSTPSGEITDVTPTFKWSNVSDVPYYHVIVTDEKVTIGDDNSIEGLSIIWQAITAETQITYGAPDPSGTLTASPPPLSPGVEYSWFVLNNYGNNPAMTAVDISLPKIFSIVGDTMATPVLLSPADGDSLKSSDFDTKEFTLTWTNLDSNANTYKVYLYAASQDSIIDAQIAVWDGEVTAGSFSGGDGSIVVDAQSILTTNTYTWKVIAVDSKGYGQASENSSFHYTSVTGGLKVRTYENISTGETTVEQPVALCEIQVEVLDGSMETPLLFYTDGNGYLYRSRPVGTYRLTAVKDGYTTISKTVTITEGDTSEVTLYLERPDATVYGKVVDNLGEDVNIATVTAVSTNGDTVATETDPLGNFVVNCGKGDWDIIVSKSGYNTTVPVRITVDFGESKSLGENIVLTPNSYVLKGTISNSAGEPLVAAKVQLFNSNNALVAEDPSTQSSGFYNFSVNPGSYTLVVSKTGFTSFSESFELTSTTEKNVTLSSGAAQIKGSIFGRNWSFTGEPTIAAIRDMDIIAYDHAGSKVAVATTDSWGAFTLSVPGGATGDEVTYTLKYSAEGYQVDSGDVNKVISGVTYTYADTLDGFANIQGNVRESGSSTVKGGIQISLINVATDEIYVSGKSDNSGHIEFYSLVEGEYQIQAAGTGVYADSINLILLSDGSVIPEVSNVTVDNGRVYYGDPVNGEVLSKFDITVAAATGSIVWTAQLPSVAEGSADIKVLTPLVAKVASGETLSDVGLGYYRVEVDAADVKILDCSRHITQVVDTDLLEETVALPFYHTALDTTEQSGSDVYLDLIVDKALLGARTVTSAKIYYKDIDANTFESDTVSSFTGETYAFVVTPSKTGSYMEYYFHVVLDDGDEFGYSKQVSRTFIEPNKTLITRLELVPATDTNGYTIPLSGSMKLQLRGYYGDSYIPLDDFTSSQVRWSSTGAVGVTPVGELSTVDLVGNGAGLATVSATLKGESGYTLGTGIDSVVTQKVTVTNGVLKSMVVELISSHKNNAYITNNETAQFSVSALDTDNKKVTVTPTWSLYPASAGEISGTGVFTPDSLFTGRVQIIATVNETIRAEYTDAVQSGMLVGYSIKAMGDTVKVSDGFEMTLVIPDSSVDSGSSVAVTIEHPTYINTVYKTVPQEGVSLVSRIFNIRRQSSGRFRTDSITVGSEVVSRSSLVEAKIKIPEQYYEFIDGGGSKFTLGIWNHDSLSWGYKWKPVSETDTRAEGDPLPGVLSSIRYEPSDSSFYVSIGDSLNISSGIGLAVLFNEDGDIQGDLRISPNPFSPYVVPLDEYNVISGKMAGNAGTIIRITPMSSTSSNNPNVTVNIYTANRTLVWEYNLNGVLPGKNYYLIWDGKTRRGRGQKGEVIAVAEDTPIRPIGNEMCRNGRYFAVVTIDDGKTEKRFTKEIILFK